MLCIKNILQMKFEIHTSVTPIIHCHMYIFIWLKYEVFLDKGFKYIVNLSMYFPNIFFLCGFHEHVYQGDT